MAREEGRQYFWTHGVATQVEYVDRVGYLRH